MGFRSLVGLGVVVLAVAACSGPPDASRCAQRLDVTPTIPSFTDRAQSSVLFVRRESGAVEVLGYRLGDGTTTPLIGVVVSDAADIDLSPDGTRLAVALREAGAIDLLSLATGEAERLDIAAIHPDWSPDGTSLAAATAAGELLVIAVDGGEVRSIPLSPYPGPVFSPSWSPDGRWLVVAVDAVASSLGFDEIHLVDAGSGATRRIVRGVAVDGATWAPDGTRIAYHDFDGVSVACRDGALAARLAGDSAFPVWSPDATEIALTTLAGRVGLSVVPSAGGGGMRITEGEDIAVDWRRSQLP